MGLKISPPYSLTALFENERWNLKISSRIRTVQGVIENQAYVLTFRQEVKRWKNLEDLLLFVSKNYADYEELKVILPFDLTLISEKGNNHD